MLRIATYNINGIRAAQRRGIEPWLAVRQPDVVALQEVRCPAPLLPDGPLDAYHLTYEPGTLPGRNGVAVLTRHAPVAVRTWGGPVLRRMPGERHTDLVAPDDSPATDPLARELRKFAHEGRYVEVDLADVPLTVASLYLPKGGLPAELQIPGRMREAPDGGAKYQRKMRFLAGFGRHLARTRKAAAAQGRHFLLMGDLNIAHQPLDVNNWRTKQKSEGFLPSEREWIDAQINPRTLVDVIRRLHRDVQGPYSWWSWLGDAFDRDVGWRIDYHLATPGLARLAVAGGTDREPSAEARVSDHAPVVVDYDL